MPAGLASTALVLSIAAPFGGQNWYYLTLLSPLSGFYYWQRGTRQEEVQVRSQLPSSLAPMFACIAARTLIHGARKGMPECYGHCSSSHSGKGRS